MAANVTKIYQKVHSRKFREQKMCPKCGSQNLKRTYVAEREHYPHKYLSLVDEYDNVTVTVFGEHLMVECVDCGFNLKNEAVK